MIRGNEFFLSQRTGRWRWPWLVLGIAVSVVGLVVMLLWLFLAFEIANEFDNAWVSDFRDYLDSDVVTTTTVPSFLAVELYVIGASFWAAAVLGSLVQGRPVRSLVEPVRSFDCSITRKVLTLQAVLFSATVAPMFFLPWLDPLDFTGFGQEHLIWLAPMLGLILIQTSGEDVFFKGYLLRQIGAVTKVFWFAPLVVVLVFVSLHIGNPDIQTELWLILPAFAISEVMAIYLTMRTAGMEAALTWHWFNNATIFLLVAERATQANDLTLFVFDDDPGTITDDAISIGLYALFLVVQLLAFTMRRSPFFLEPHRWQRENSTSDETTGWDTPAPPPMSPPPLLSELR